MSNAFTNFLSGAVNGVFGPGPDLKDYQHANRLYVNNNYARAPKTGFLYYVVFNMNSVDLNNSAWLNQGGKDAGLLVKRIDLPKFDIATEVVNQYNRKTVIQTSLKYTQISLDFHDDNSDITNGLWTNYMSYYYADNSAENKHAFNDNKYSEISHAYGIKNNNGIRNAATGLTSNAAPFLDSIDIYVLHQGKFTQITLVNPLITNWAHDTLNQEEGGKILANKMSIVYETVRYANGKITAGSAASAFTAVYYDKSPSPLSVNGNGTSTIFGAGGVIAGADSVLGSLASGNFLAAAIQAKTTVSNLQQLSKAGLKTEGYSIINGVLGQVQATGNQPGGIGPAIQTGINQSGIGALGNIGINLFSNKNSSINGTTTAKPSNLTGS